MWHRRWSVLSVSGVAFLAACAPVPLPDLQGERGLIGTDVIHQTVSVAPFSADGVLKGEQTLTFRTTTQGDRLRFQGGPLRITSLRIDGRDVVDWTMTDGLLDIVSPLPLTSGSEHVLTVWYEASPGRGFRRSDDLVYTTYFACDWMLCDQQNFDDRFTFDLTLQAPVGMVSLGPGTQGETIATLDGESHRWRTGDDYPAYVHGFVIGRLDRFEPSTGCATRLDVLSAAPRDRVAAVFQPTCAMLGYFEERAGVPYPAERYSQFYDPDRWEAQEAISHSVLGGGAVEAMITDPTEDWAVAHELAHQWWGNRVTAQTLSEFWLNEGMVTFMVASWKEHRWGDAAYAREIGLARSRWQRCRDEWRDVPIAFAGEYPSLATRRCFQYSKAAVFLHELRVVMGDGPFWSGVRGFTVANLGQSVTSHDFEEAMQRETGTDLGPLFAEWVYSADTGAT